LAFIDWGINEIKTLPKFKMLSKSQLLDVEDLAKKAHKSEKVQAKIIKLFLKFFK